MMPPYYLLNRDIRGPHDRELDQRSYYLRSITNTEVEALVQGFGVRIPYDTTYITDCREEQPKRFERKSKARQIWL